MSQIVNQQLAIAQGLQEDLKRYFSETTVHGFRYVVEGRNRLERLVWVLFILFGFTYTAYLVYNAYVDWERHPVQTTIDEVGLPVQELPFPAITLCDINSQKMPRRNRWMFVETLLNSVERTNSKEQMKRTYLGMLM